MQHYQVPGLSIALIQDHRVAWVKHYGVKKQHSSDSVTDATLFQAASLSKPVASIMAMQKASSVPIDPEADVNQYLRSWTLTAEKSSYGTVSLANLLSHTGGVNISGFPGYPVGQQVPSLRAILQGEAPATNPPIAVTDPPGKRFAYSGGGFCVVQQLLADIDSRSFADIAQQDIFAPLGMNHSFFEQPLDTQRIAQAASGHYQDGEPIEGDFFVYPELAAGGLWTTAEDMATLLVAMQLAYQGTSQAMITSATAQQMLTPYQNPIYGLGFYLDGEGEDIYFTHNGNNIGFQNNFVMHRQHGYGAVVFTNSDNGKHVIEKVLEALSLEYQWSNFPCDSP